MKTITAFASEKLGAHSCLLKDSAGREFKSASATALLSFLADEHTNDRIKVVYNMAGFLAPIKELLPKDTVKLFDEGGDAYLGANSEFKLFYNDSGKGRVFGINHKARRNESNVYDTYDINIYDLAWYFPDEKPTSPDAVKVLGEKLLKLLGSMGFEPTKLTSPAAIIEECVLSKMPLPTICNLPESCQPMMEWAMNYTREWRTVYKVGLFKKGQAWDYDLGFAYGSIMAVLPNMTGAEFYHCEGGVPENATWGISLANIDVRAEVSPLISADEGNYRGEREDFITNEETAYCRATGKAEILPLESWYFIAKGNRPIYEYLIKRLYNLRAAGGLQERIAKSQAVSIWGKMQEVHEGKHGVKYGKLCNFIYGSMVASRCRLMVVRFIEEHELEPDLVSVTVDGMIATKDIPGIPEKSTFGGWRKNPASAAVVLSSDFQWIGDKKQLGVTAGEIIQAIKEHPNRQEYLKIYLPTMQHDRDFGKIPLFGRDLLKRVYESQAVVLKEGR